MFRHLMHVAVGVPAANTATARTMSSCLSADEKVAANVPDVLKKHW
jgi:hypothetical protein